MTLAFLVYMIGALEGVVASRFVMIVCGFGAIAALATHFIIRNDEYSNYKEGSAAEAKKYFNKFICFFFAACFVCIAVPKENTAYMMAGAYATQKIYESPETAKIQGKVLAILNDKLDSYLPEEKTKTKKESE